MIAAPLVVEETRGARIGERVACTNGQTRIAAQGKIAGLLRRRAVANRLTAQGTPLMRLSSIALIAVASSLPSLASASCFSIYTRQDRLVYQSTVIPIDLALPISQGLRPSFPNTHMVMDPNETSCTEVGPGSSSARGVSRDLNQSMSTGPLGRSPVTRDARAPVSTAVGSRNAAGR